MEARIRQLAAMLENCEIVEGTDGDVVEPGSVVQLRYEGDDDVDTYFYGSVEERGVEHDIISPGSPLGQALAGRDRGRQGVVRVAHRRHPHRRGRHHLSDDPAATGARSAGLPTACCPAGRSTSRAAGTTFVRLRARRRGAPTVLLLHGLGVTADANWFPAYPPLAERYGVVAIDHRGHGRGIRPERPVRLADCADDAVAALDVLGIDRAIVVGYSMGGPIAQLVWHRHRARAAGLVLCATAHRFRGLEPMRDLGPSLVQRLRATTTPVGRRGRLDRGPAPLARRRARPHRPATDGAGRAVAGSLRRLAMDRRCRRAPRGRRHDTRRRRRARPPAAARSPPCRPVRARGRHRPHRLRHPPGRVRPRAPRRPRRRPAVAPSSPPTTCNLSATGSPCEICEVARCGGPGSAGRPAVVHPHGVLGTVRRASRRRPRRPVVFVAVDGRVVIPIDTVKAKGRARLQRLTQPGRRPARTLLSSGTPLERAHLWSWCAAHWAGHGRSRSGTGGLLPPRRPVDLPAYPRRRRGAVVEGSSSCSLQGVTAADPPAARAGPTTGTVRWEATSGVFGPISGSTRGPPATLSRAAWPRSSGLRLPVAGESVERAEPTV